MGKNKITTLILVPYLFKQGGVALFYKSIRPHLNSNYIYFYRGNKSSKYEKTALFYYFIDYLNFCRVLMTNKIDFIVINTSLAKAGCYRDAIFILILKFLRKKFMVFFHGWNKEYQHKIDASDGSVSFPINQFKSASGIIVLAREFKNKLKTWGFGQNIYLGKTVVDESLISDYVYNRDRYRESNEPFVFFFLARIEKEKGICEAIEIFEGVQKSNLNRKFVFKIGGDGRFTKHVKKFVKDKNIANVEFLGNIDGEVKRLAFEKAHFFLFPSYGEGMPLAVLEAMAFGLPVLVTPVGGINDFFENGNMGILLPKLNIESAVTSLNKLIIDYNKLHIISEFNYKYARMNFLSNNVAKNLDFTIQDIYSKE